MAAPEEEDAPQAPDWIVTFTDLISLLVAFFVLLLTFSSLDVKDAFRVDGDLLGTRGTIQGDGGSSSVTPPQIDVMQAIDAARGADSSHSRPTDKLAKNLAEMGQKKSNAHQEFDLKSVKDGIVLHFDEEGAFAPGSAEVNSNLRQSLGELGRVLENYSHMVTVEGFTDNAFKANASYGSVNELSFARASAAANVMLGASKLSPKLVQLSGLGDSKQLNENATSVERRANRRVELRILSLSKTRQASIDRTREGR